MNGIEIVRRGIRMLLVRPGLLLALLGIHFVFAAAIYTAANWTLGPLLHRRPDPDLFGWIALLIGHVDCVRLVFFTVSVVAAYLLGGSLILGAVLEHLAGGRWLRGARRHLWGLVRFRLLLWVALGLILAGWFVSAPPLYHLGLKLDHDKAPAAIQLVLALLFGLPAIALLLIYRYGQCLIVRGHGPLSALRRSLYLLHHRTALCFGLWLLGWLTWIFVSLLGLLFHEWWLLSAQLVVLFRSGVFIWEYATAQLCVRC